MYNSLTFKDASQIKLILLPNFPNLKKKEEKERKKSKANRREHMYTAPLH